VTTDNSFYELGLDKGDPAAHAHTLHHKDASEPVAYGTVLAALLAIRLVAAARRRVAA